MGPNLDQWQRRLEGRTRSLVRAIATFIVVLVALLLLASLVGGVGSIEVAIILLIALVAAVAVAIRTRTVRAS